jgi:hypothetical protein
MMSSTAAMTCIRGTRLAHTIFQMRDTIHLAASASGTRTEPEFDRRTLMGCV